MTLILTNDDGIDAPGIRALMKAINDLNTGNQGLLNEGYPVVIAAPKDHLSGCAHQVTTTSPIYVHRRSDSEYAIAGTPADCVRIALTHICKNIQFVVSGINAGGNLGVDAYISGTVAAVREAAMHGIPGIAVSHYRKGKLNVDWDVAARWTTNILADLLNRPLEPGTFWNVNLPHLLPGEPDPEVVFCQPCTKPLPVNYRIESDEFYYVGVYQERDRTPGSDVDVCFAGKIAVTQLRV
ncbi:MAG: 5'/3'-nucleotidase SurE [Chlorogloeopsis fritschii C42_A2020_084]|uniref:5'/3'-nucleotidase SurE n=1 Tax=Chlorogloeopsis fritschii TaxID=1124 RepID=UPI0019FFF1AC|nr:5'/3'-nucleotidase SurE [Chlorogloeopsis fritschii]MBF2008281.1 5'/3'-nucleotidase SurE [Chlorogloeopsis fritschii C42_A2020_084]